MLMCTLTFLLALVSPVVSDFPGFQLRVTQSGLDYASEEAMNALDRAMSTLSIDPQSGESGDLEYRLWNIEVTSFTKPSSRISVVPGRGMRMSVSNAAVSVYGQWRATYTLLWILPLSLSGTVRATVSGVSATVGLGLGMDSATGRPTLQPDGCRSSVRDVDITTRGFLSFIVDLFTGSVERKLERLIPGQLCGTINNLIRRDASDQLAKLQVVVPLLNDTFSLDYRLVSPPVFRQDFLDTHHKGEITWSADPESPPFAAQPLVFPNSTDRMLYLMVGEFLPKSFLHAAQQNGFLQFNLTYASLDPDHRGILNTSCVGVCVGSFIPDIGNRYPNSAVRLHMKTTSVPTLNSAADGLHAGLRGEIALCVNATSGDTPCLLTLDVSADLSLSASINNQTIKFRITHWSFNADVRNSVLEVNSLTANINSLVRLVMEFFVVPQINNKGENGFPLPVIDDFELLNTDLQILEDALVIATDVQYREVNLEN